jgi:hypothetical protein
MWRFVCLAAVLLAFAAQADPVRTVAARIVAEGLAMRTVRNPPPDTDFAEAAQHRAEILQTIRASLDAPRPGGTDLEFRYAAWQVVGFWLAHGVSVAEIARIKDADASARVAEAIDLMLKEPRL